MTNKNWISSIIRYRVAILLIIVMGISAYLDGYFYFGSAPHIKLIKVINEPIFARTNKKAFSGVDISKDVQEIIKIGADAEEAIKILNSAGVELKKMQKFKYKMFGITDQSLDVYSGSRLVNNFPFFFFSFICADKSYFDLQIKEGRVSDIKANISTVCI
ncbi:MAG: hypothetical protein D8M28_01555 [Proteobacteria bacterium]|nr:hypothetical protein [Pseudomonadota bacterium]